MQEVIIPKEEERIVIGHLTYKKKILHTILADQILQRYLQSEKPIKKAKKLLKEYNDNVIFELFSLSKYQRHSESSIKDLTAEKTDMENEKQALQEDVSKSDIQISKKKTEGKIQITLKNMSKQQQSSSSE